MIDRARELNYQNVKTAHETARHLAAREVFELEAF